MGPIPLPSVEDLGRCPHCRAASVLVAHEVVRWACGVCGGPRIPWSSKGRPGKEIPRLIEVRQARFAAFGWGAAAWMLLGSTVIALVLGALLLPVALLASVLLFASGITVAVLAIASARRAKGHRARAFEALEAAWDQAAEELLRAHGGEMTASELAAHMRVDEAFAERTLARLSATAPVSVRFDDRDDPRLLYAHEDPPERPARRGEGT